MALTVDFFFCCLDLKLGSIIMSWWGMIFSGISIIGGILALIFDKGNWSSHFPVHFNTGSALTSLIVSLILLCIYFYFSYQLLLGAQSNDSGLMLGYLVIHGIFVIFWVYVAIVGNASTLLLAALYIYLWFCVYSFYVKCGGRGIA